MVRKHRLVVLSSLTLAALACEDSLTGIPDPVVDEAPAVEVVAPVAMVHGGGCLVPDGSGLVSWWPGEGTFDDIYGVNPTVTPKGVTFGGGLGGSSQGFMFDGKKVARPEGGVLASYMEIVGTDPSLKPEAFTVDLWAERTGDGLNRGDDPGNVLIQKAIEDHLTGPPFVSYNIVWQNDGRLWVQVAFETFAPKDFLSLDAFPDDHPIFVALTVDHHTASPRKMTLYVFDPADPGKDPYQGSEDITGRGPVKYGDGSVIVGATLKSVREGLSFPRSFEGNIDEVEIFGRALDPGKLRDIFEYGKCTNVAPTVDEPAGGTVDEGTAFGTTVTFTDDSDSWTATADYGDGVVEALGAVSTGFALSHAYADNGEYTVTVTVTDVEGAEGSASTTVTVNNVAPAVSPIPDATIAEGDVWGPAGSFTDPGADTWTATVDYGDGGGPGPLTLTGKTFALSHTYAQDGEYTVTVTVTDDEGAPGSTSATVTVNNVAPMVSVIPDATMLEGSTFEAEGSFTDPGVDDTWNATVNYGDGSGDQPLALVGMSFNLSHTYAGNEACGPYTATVTVSDADGGEGQSTAQVTVIHQISVDKGHVKLDRRRRSRRSMDGFDVDGRLPASLVGCLDPNEVVTVGIGDMALEVPAGALVRKGRRGDHKWYYRAGGRTSGINKFELRDDGRFKIEVRGSELGDVDFSEPLVVSISLGPDSGQTEVEFDRRGRLRRVWRYFWNWRKG